MSRVWQSVFPLVLDNIFFDKSTDSKPKFFDAVSAVRPGDSQGGGFSAAPLEPASDQFSRRDKKIPPGGTGTESFWGSSDEIRES